MATGDLTTLATAKQWLNVTTSGADDTLTRLITAASGFVQTYINRTIAVTQYSEALTGSGSATLAIPNYPIVSVDSLMLRGVAVPPSVDGMQAGFVFDERFLYLLGGGAFLFGQPGATGVFPSWPPLAVKVQYTAGFATVPPDIEQAVLELMGQKFSDRDHFGQVSKAILGEVVSFSVADMPSATRTVLNSYCKVVPA